jgi:hypothetical protein
MRVFPVAALMIVLSSAAIAQTPNPAGANPPGDAAPALPPATDGISRDDYIAKARDAAAKRAETRFDEMDANHDGVLSKDEIAAYRVAHARKKPAEPQ